MSNFKRPREMNPDHLAFVRALPCASCGNDIETEAAHVRFGCLEIAKPQTGMQIKPDDKYTVPLCNRCHTAQHAYGNEQAWWDQLGRDPIKLSLALYSVSGNLMEGERIIRARP